MPDLTNLPDGAKVFVDTNIFYLYFTSRSVSCASFMTKLARGQVTAFVNTQVLSDLLHKLMLYEANDLGLISRPAATSLKEALKANRNLNLQLSQYQTQFESVLDMGVKVLPIDGRVLTISKLQRDIYGLMVGDSVHICNMQNPANSIEHLITHDGDFAHMTCITVWSPMDVIT